MRVTHRMIFDDAVQNLQENLSRIAQLREQVSSGKKLARPSDDPSLAAAVLGLRAGLQASQAYVQVAEESVAWMQASETALKAMTDLTTRAITLSQQGLPDTLGPQERQGIAAEMEGLLQEALDVANSTHGGKYLFAGYRINSKPFSLVSGTPDSVSYAGDNGTIRHALGPGETVTVNVDGDATFSPLFAALIRARDALNNNDQGELQAALSDLQAAQQGVSLARTANGARQRQVEHALDRMQESQGTLKTLLSQKEDLSLAEAISQLRQQETIYQAVLEAGRRTLNLPNLFEMLG